MGKKREKLDNLMNLTLQIIRDLIMLSGIQNLPEALAELLSFKLKELNVLNRSVRIAKYQ